MKLKNTRARLNRWWEENVDRENFRELLRLAGDETDPLRAEFYAFVAQHHVRSVLDCGGGTGVDAIALRKRHGTAIRVTIADVTPAFGEFIAPDLREHGVKFTEASIEALPFQARAFDLVYCKGVWEHLPHYRLALAQMLRTARSFVWVTSRRGFWTGMTKIKKEDGVFVNRYSIDEVEQYLDWRDDVESWDWRESAQVLVVRKKAKS